MALVESTELASWCRELARRAHVASAELAQATGSTKNAWLRRCNELLGDRRDDVLSANARDIEAAPGYGLSSAAIDRLRLNDKSIQSMQEALAELARLPDPVGEVIGSSVRPNGLAVTKVRVPLGVVFFIYESRPNVTVDAAAICVKSGNAVILRGGKEAAYSNQALVDVMVAAADECGLPADALAFVNSSDREAVGHFLRLPEYISVAIPRGGEGLIRRVTAEAQMPVIKHFTGNCHVYVDAEADLDMAQRIVINAKCQRMGVCNAAESLLIHAAVADEFLPRIAHALAGRDVELRGDERCRKLAATVQPATEADYAAEYLGPVMSVKVVDSLDEAIEHINRYGSRHTDAIVTAALGAARRFTLRVDSAAVMVNASTRFNDGGELGLGAEIGISTDKIHARGPCGLTELTSYKYVVYGDGHVRQ